MYSSTNPTMAHILVLNPIVHINVLHIILWYIYCLCGSKNSRLLELESRKQVFKSYNVAIFLSKFYFLSLKGLFMPDFVVTVQLNF